MTDTKATLREQTQGLWARTETIAVSLRREAGRLESELFGPVPTAMDKDAATPAFAASVDGDLVCINDALSDIALTAEKLSVLASRVVPERPIENPPREIGMQEKHMETAPETSTPDPEAKPKRGPRVRQGDHSSSAAAKGDPLAGLTIGRSIHFCYERPNPPTRSTGSAVGAR